MPEAKITSAPRAVAERGAVDAATFVGEVSSAYRPVILRGQVAHWPAVAAGRAGPRAIADYLRQFAGGKPLEVFIGKPEIEGRFFYDTEVRGFNFHRQQVPLDALVMELLRVAEQGGERPYAIYANAATTADHSPGWLEANALDLPLSATPRLWIGNAVQVATHFDASPNIACVVAGRRRFTLFPPEQLENLYLGPLDKTPAGPPISMVDPEAPDFDRYPRFAEALAASYQADLEPGDALFIPAIWWHHVRSFDALNVLVNYWTDPTGPSPFGALVHAVLAVRDLPSAERAAWRSWFEALVFDDGARHAADHLPSHARTVLGPASPERTARIRHYLMTMLQRGG